MANAYCLWRHSKSPMQSNLSPDSLVPPFHSPPVSFTTIVYLFRRTVCAPPTPFPPPRGQCKLILSCIKRCEASHSSYPAATSLSHDISISPFLHLSHFSFASNDIYAILIEYLLYMRLHIQAFSLPLPSTHLSHFRLVAVSMPVAQNLRTISRSPETNSGGRLCGNES